MHKLLSIKYDTIYEDTSTELRSTARYGNFLSAHGKGLWGIRGGGGGDASRNNTRDTGSKSHSKKYGSTIQVDTCRSYDKCEKSYNNCSIYLRIIISFLNIDLLVLV